jgi:ankyrin repeat protein
MRSLNFSIALITIIACFLSMTTIAMETQEYIYKKIIAEIRNNNLDTFTKLMENYQDINAVNQDGYSIPHYGFIHGNKAIMDLMLKYQADINIKSQNNLTPLMCSVFNYINRSGINCSLQGTQYLLDAGANLEIKSGSYYNHQTIFELILEKRAHNTNAAELAYLFLNFLNKKCLRLEQELAEKTRIEEKLLFRYNSCAKLFSNPRFLQNIQSQYNADQESDGSFASNWTSEHQALWLLVQNNGILLRRK